MYVLIKNILLLAYIAVLICGKENNQTLVDYYVNLIKNRSQEALKFQFPTDARMYKAVDREPQEYGVFDFIIIGAGASGCVIANRLSEISDWKILVLEAGTYRDDDLTGIPLFWITDVFTKFNWGYQSVPQKYGCQGFTEKRCFVPRGKGVGGSTLINGMMIARGNKYDYDRWSEMLDDPGWNYENIVPYYKKLENFSKTNPFVPIDPDDHGYNGPLHVTQPSPSPEISHNLLKGGVQLGYNVTDYNGEHELGVSVLQLYTKNGFRHDFEKAFLSPAKNRRNLIILDHSYVIKINISSATNKVLGVTFIKENKTYFAKIRREVILSAGAVSSPQILMLSGIGPRNHLKSIGISVIQDLPVGQNLRDHTITPLVFSTNITNNDLPLEKFVRNFIKTEGEFSSFLPYDTVGWMNTSKEKVNCPDASYSFLNLSGGYIAKRFFGWTDETFKELNLDVPNPLATFLVNLDPKSVGTIRLKSADPYEYPLIDPNILSANEDVERIYRSIQQIIDLINTDAFRAMNVTLTTDESTLCSHTEPLSKQFWYCYIRIVSGIGSDLVGSCSTAKDPQTGVVDRRLKVFGIQGLRVADASVIPREFAGYPSGICAIVGEKASDFIKQDHQHSHIISEEL